MKQHLGVVILVLVLMNSKYFYLPFINFPTTGVKFTVSYYRLISGICCIYKYIYKHTVFIAPPTIVGRVPFPKILMFCLILRSTFASVGPGVWEVSVSSGVVFDFLCFCPLSSGEPASSCHWFKKEKSHVDQTWTQT